MSIAPVTASTDQLAAAAGAAAALLPSATPLVLGPTDGSLAPGSAGSAVLTAFTGALSGSVVLLVDPALEQALATAEGGPLPLTDAVRPAVVAAIDALGTALAGASELVPAAGLVSRPDITWMPLVGGADTVVWIGLQVATTPGEASAMASAAVAALLPGEAKGLNLLRDVELTLTVELGRTRMSVRDLLALAPGSVVELDRAAGAPADLMVNGRLLARGEIVVVDEDYGLRITEIIEPGQEG